jgi:endonuclease G
MSQPARLFFYFLLFLAWVASLVIALGVGFMLGARAPATAATAAGTPATPPAVTAATSGTTGSAVATTANPAAVAGPGSAPAANSESDDNDPLGLPTSTRALTVLHKEHFTIGYDPAARIPGWVSYCLGGPIRFHGHEHRPDRFLPDAAVSSSPRSEDYSRSGFDRGHMCPAYALFSRFGAPGMDSTFITTNICPQAHGLNAGRWEDLESLIAGREGEGGGWAERYAKVYVTDGPVLNPEGEHLRAGEAVPISFFMVLLRRENDGHFRSLGFEMPNHEVSEPVDHFLVSIHSIEIQTGLNFATALPADEQEALKGEAARSLW